MPVSGTRVDALVERTAQAQEARHRELLHEIAGLTARVDALSRGTRAAQRAAKEAVWGRVFADTTAQSSWFTDTALSPGRWAVGYPFLYALYRVLDESRPSSILELGLGQSSKLTGQYAGSREGVRHVVVEHDPDWIAAFGRNYALPPATRLERLDLAGGDAEGREVLHYDGFAAAVGDSRYDLILIDGPFGSGAERSRLDVLDLIPGGLAESFVILLDDYQRPGERFAAEAIADALTGAGIEHVTSSYSGDKEIWMAASPDMRFFTTM